MIDIAEIFGSKALDEDKLLACGFERADGGGFSRTFQILDDEYAAVVHFSDNGEPSFRVFDGDGEEGVAEVINLKDEPAIVRERIASGAAYPAYHMNKQHWYTLFLDDHLSDGEVVELIKKSYAIVNA